MKFREWIFTPCRSNSWLFKNQKTRKTKYWRTTKDFVENVPSYIDEETDDILNIPPLESDEKVKGRK